MGGTGVPVGEGMAVVGATVMGGATVVARASAVTDAPLATALVTLVRAGGIVSVDLSVDVVAKSGFGRGQFRQPAKPCCGDQ